MHTHALYFKMMVWPTRGTLAYDHGFNSTTTAMITTMQDNRNYSTLFAYSIVILILCYAIYQKKSILLICLCFSVGSIAPALNIVFWVGTVLAERLLYVPSIGYCIVFGIYVNHLIYYLLHNINTTKSQGKNSKSDTNNNRPHFISKGTSRGKDFKGEENTRPEIISKGLLLMLMLFLCICSYVMFNHSRHRSLEWLNEPILYETGYQTNPTSAKIMNNLAQVLLRSGNTTDAIRANVILKRSYLILPTASGLYNQGLAHSSMGNKTEAISYMQLALQVRPQSKYVLDFSNCAIHNTC